MNRPSQRRLGNELDGGSNLVTMGLAACAAVCLVIIGLAFYAGHRAKVIRDEKHLGELNQAAIKWLDSATAASKDSGEKYVSDLEKALEGRVRNTEPAKGTIKQIKTRLKQWEDQAKSDEGKKKAEAVRKDFEKALTAGDCPSIEAAMEKGDAYCTMSQATDVAAVEAKLDELKKAASDKDVIARLVAMSDEDFAKVKAGIAGGYQFSEHDGLNKIWHCRAALLVPTAEHQRPKPKDEQLLRVVGSLIRPASSFDDPELDQAWLAYAKAIDKAARRLQRAMVAARAKAKEDAATTGEVEKYLAIGLQLKQQAESLDLQGKLPSHPAVREEVAGFEAASEAARLALNSVYRSVVTRLGTDSSVDETVALAVLDESKKLFPVPPPDPTPADVVGRWRLPNHVVVFKENNTVDEYAAAPEKVPLRGTWTISKGTINVTYKGSSAIMRVAGPGRLAATLIGPEGGEKQVQAVRVDGRLNIWRWSTGRIVESEKKATGEFFVDGVRAGRFGEKSGGGIVLFWNGGPAEEYVLNAQQTRLDGKDSSGNPVYATKVPEQ